MQRAKTTDTLRRRVLRQVASWPVLAGVLFVIAAASIALVGGATLSYSIGQYVASPISADVDFQVRDPRRTETLREAARAATPSYYSPNARALTFDRIRADLLGLYRAAADADTFEAYEASLGDVGWPAEHNAYTRLRSLVDLPGDAGRIQYDQWVDALPLEREYVVESPLREPRRGTKSATDFIVLEVVADDGHVTAREIRHSNLVPQSNDKALRGSAAAVVKRFAAFELRPTVEAVVLGGFRKQPTIVFNDERTSAKMREAKEATPDAMTAYEKGKRLISAGELDSEGYQLLLAHRRAYSAFLGQNTAEAARLRWERWLQRGGMITLVVLLSIGLLVYTGMNQPRVFEIRTRTIAFAVLILGTLLAARLLDLKWPHIPELVFGPCLLAGIMLAIVYPRRFATGAMCMTAVIVTTIVGGDLFFMLTLFTGVALVVYQLDEIRSRTKLISSGVVTAVAMMIASAAGGFLTKQRYDFVVEHAGWAGLCALLASFVASGVLPFIERMFRAATSLTLLEWRDPTKPLLQLLARKSPGTYNHSLVLGTLAEAACESIGANGLLAQVGALYHDIGKIHKAEYFAENQEGRVNRHDSLAPTMSLLIILGHVKDGVATAKEYKLPRILHQFIEEHHGTTVVRYFHHMASERQPRIASGKHDREVSEAEFRYGGPRPRSRESAVVMLCDGVESAARALQEPAVGRIESVVHQIVMDRLNDGQLDDCDITLKEIRKVEESLVKSLCGIYHGRLAYPKARREREEPVAQEKVTG